MKDNKKTSPTYKMLTAALAERRSKPRVNCSYPATIRGRDPYGQKFEAPAVLANMSSAGIYLRMRRSAQVGERLFIVVRLATMPLSEADAPHIAAYGEVKRVEPKPDGAYGVALKLVQYRFL